MGGWSSVTMIGKAREDVKKVRGVIVYLALSPSTSATLLSQSFHDLHDRRRQAMGTGHDGATVHLPVARSCLTLAKELVAHSQSGLASDLDRLELASNTDLESLSEL